MFIIGVGMSIDIDKYIKSFIVDSDSKIIVESTKIVNNKGFDCWSFKKLIFLKYYIKPYLDIMQRHVDKCFYLDLFSGCGANKLGNLEIFSIGSPIVSILSGVRKLKNGKINKFDKWFFIDQNKEYCDSLNDRVKKTVEMVEKNEGVLIDNDDIRIICGDCNDKIDDVITEINELADGSKISLLVFIDPYKFTNIKWRTIEKILELKYVDVIFNFPTGTMKRSVELKNWGLYLPPSLLSMKSDVCTMKQEEVTKRYAEDMSKIMKRKKSMTFYTCGISVRTRKQTEISHIKLFTHCDKNIIIKITDGIFVKLDKLRCSDLENIIEKVIGKQRGLKRFLK